jgi:hypothetical protein
LGGMGEKRERETDRERETETETQRHTHTENMILYFSEKQQVSCYYSRDHFKNLSG